MLSAVMTMTRFALVFTLSAVAAATAEARCQLGELERFLAQRAFELPADEKIALYADRLVQYYDRRDVSRGQVLGSMRGWERRWPERIYAFLRVTDFKETEAGDACKVTFDYRFLAHSPVRGRTSAGIGNTTMILADLEGDGAYRIIGEFGDVRCRGLPAFKRGRC